ncbi:DUF6867 family protein [Oleispirillum naphthae]|uniref:DUF6867 family protein n=1 Tax=Oleispirillum naphthae TaxID=2838853 RepID=UPI0030825769
MIAALGSSLTVFIGFTCIMMGWISFMTGRAIANTWRPRRQVVPYCLLLGLANRFFVFSLFGGQLLSVSGWLIGSVYLVLVGFASHREKEAFKMVAQYPWLYERSGPFDWRERRHAVAEETH